MASNGKPKIAFFDFACCEGCQLTVIDALQTHLELVEAVEIVQWREAMTEKGEDYQIAFIEGSCTRAEDEERLKQIREQADIVVALGACAHIAGVNALKNLQPSLQDVREYVYGDKWEWYDSYPARPISAVIEVDAVIDIMVGGTSFLLLKREEFHAISVDRGADGLLVFMRNNSL